MTVDIWEKLRESLLLSPYSFELTEVEKKFVLLIERKGFHYNMEYSNSVSERWTRRWSTDYGNESILEAYLKTGDVWVQQMISVNGEVFYEETVDLNEKTS